MYDLQEELNQQRALLKEAQYESLKRGRLHAKYERDYKVANAKKIAIERASGTPVTIIMDMCKGDPEVADLRFKRDIACVEYNSAQEAINVYKLNARLIESQINREWGQRDGI